MRLNVFIAQASGLSRRSSDKAIEEGRVFVNGTRPEIGTKVTSSDAVTLDGNRLTRNSNTTTIMLNKPVGYVCSRDGQGSKTIYDLLPDKFHRLKPVGRLDKDSSGLLLLTDDGQLANELTHPRYQKTKVYEINLDKPLTAIHLQMITHKGVMLDDGLSKLEIKRGTGKLTIVMQEGRNRQIRRTFESLGYKVNMLHRTNFGLYELDKLETSNYVIL